MDLMPLFRKSFGYRYEVVDMAADVRAIHFADPERYHTDSHRHINYIDPPVSAYYGTQLPVGTFGPVHTVG